MRGTYLIICLITFAIVLSGCGGGGGNGGPVNPPPPEPEKPEWTVMVYMGGNNNLASFAIGDLQELEEVGSSEKVKFTVLADIAYEQFSYLGGFESIMITDNNGTPIVPMMQIGRYPEDGIQSHLTDTKAVLYPANTFNSADPSNLTNFIKWSAQRFPAKHYALVLWDHGGSWTPGRNVAAIIQDIDQANGEAMNISEVEMAIGNSGTHIDVLDFDACNMASVEVMYQLKDVADYICASQRTEPGEGNNYSVLASSLIATPTLSPEQLGQLIVNSYIDFYAETGEQSVTKSLIKTDKLDNLANTISNLSGLLTNQGLTSNTELQSHFWEPIRFWRDVDLYNLMDVLSAYYPSMSDSINNVKSALSSVVVYNRTLTSSGTSADWAFGSREFSQGQDIIVDGIAGLNIFLPTLLDFSYDNVSYYSGLAFNFASHWYDVIHYTYWGTPFLETVPGFWWAGLVWDTNVDLDLWVFEPDGYGGIIPASPWIGPSSYNGLLSADSYWTGDSFECYIANPEVTFGPYFILATYSGPSLFENDAYCILALGNNIWDTEPSLSEVFYISEFSPNDPDFGYGVIYFGFLLYNYNDSQWYVFWDDRSGDAVRQGSFSVIQKDLVSRSLAADKVNEKQSMSTSGEAIQLYHKQGKELARKLMDRK